MRLSKRTQGLVYFAQFCRTHNVEPLDMAELTTLADRVYRHGQNECNFELSDRQQKASERDRSALHAKAESMGFGVEFYGLYPTLRRDNRDVQFPSID